MTVLIFAVILVIRCPILVWSVEDEALAGYYITNKESMRKGHKKTKIQTCTYSSEGLYDHPLVVIGACGCFKNIQENLLEENLPIESMRHQP